MSSVKQRLHDPYEFEIGDKVRVMRRAQSYTGGWQNNWEDPEMTATIGSVMIVSQNEGVMGYRLSGFFSYPSFALEKVEDE